MPIVACPGCSARLDAPDSAAGKRVKCPTPGCGTLVPVPALIVAEVEEADEPRPRSRPARAAVDEDDRPRVRRRRDDDDWDDDRPRKKRKKKAGGLSPAGAAGIVIGGLVLVAVAGYGVYALVGKKGDSSGGGGGGRGARSAVPAGWVEYRSDADRFRAYFPKAPVSGPMPPPNKKLTPARSIMRYLSGNPGDDQYIILFVAQLPPTATQADRDAYAEDFARTWRAGANVREGTATWGGKGAKEFVVPRPATKTRPESGTVVRQVTVGNTLYGAVLGNTRAVPPPEFVNGFFDNFEFLD